MSNPKNIFEIAQELGIKITRAEIDSQIFECWSDRVFEAFTYDEKIKSGEYYHKPETHANFRARRDTLIAEANRYAI